MTTPHKHKDLIIAWANGAEIEYRADSSHNWREISNPFWRATWEYRIKPQPKKCRVGLIKLYPNCSYPATILECNFIETQTAVYFIKWISPVIEYVDE